MIKKTIYTFLILIIASIIYLNYFGITTNKFNQNIQKKIQKNYPQFDLKLNDIKILFNISKLSIDLETDYPIIKLKDQEIKLKTISTTYDVKSFFKKEFAIKNLLIDTEKNQIKKIIKLARSYKDSAQLLIIGKKVSIVNEKQGTTRDVVTSSCLIDGIRFVFSDTAGIRKTLDKIEKEGIKLSRKSI